MKIVLIVQARMNSSRLPGKVLKPLVKKEPLIGVLLKRLKKVKKINELVVSTSTMKKDDPLIHFLKKKKLNILEVVKKIRLKDFITLQLRLKQR